MVRLQPNLDLATALRMTRPGFLVITLVACGLGYALAAREGQAVSLTLACIVTLAALLLHAWANVLNDYHDALSGADDANRQGLFPFTGGARLIQNAEVSVAQTRGLANLSACAVVPLAGVLWWMAGQLVVWLGLTGLCLGWAYSAPPLRLMTRGAGEFTVGLVWALMVVGAAAVCKGQWQPDVIAPALGYGMLIANILLINAFPDAQADASVGKRTAVVRLGPRRAAQAYLLLWVGAYVMLGVSIDIHALPIEAAWSLISLPVGAWGTMLLARHAHRPQQLRGAIVCTIVTAVLYGSAMAMGCLLAGA